MEIKRMVEGTARKVARYEFSTPKGEGHVTRQEIQRQLIKRAEQFAHARHYTGLGRFQQIDYEKAVSELSPEERAIERGSTVREPSQQQRASRHLAERVRHFAQEGHTRAEAVATATEEHRRSGLAALHLPRNSPWAVQGQQEQREEAHRYAKVAGAKIGNIAVKLHDAGSGVSLSTHDEKLRTARELLPRQVAASVMYRGGSQPGQAERDWLDHWFGVLVPPPAPVAGGGNAAELAAYNRMREQFLDDLMERAQQLLRDPAERAKLQPTKLGG